MKKREKQLMVKCPALHDAGCTASALTPKVAEKMIKELRTKPGKVFALMVNTCDGKVVEYNGKHLSTPYISTKY